MAGRKQTPAQKRKAAAARLERNLPAKGKSGESMVKDAEIRRAIRALKG